MDFAALHTFIAELDRLKGILRRSYPIGLERRENSAEHSWQVAMLGMSLVQDCAFAVDACRATRMLLLHDVSEIDAGDRIVYDQSNPAERAAQEFAGAQRIFALLAAPIGQEMLALWQEFEAGQSPEARYARAIDRLTPIMQNIAHHGQSWRENGIERHQVLLLNEPKIAPVFPHLWPQLTEQISALLPQ